MSAATTVTFAAADGFPLTGTLYPSTTPGPPHATVLINAGAGIPAPYYGRFAAWLAASGVAVLTYDYRGIGRSRPASLRGFATSVEEWGSKDCAAALDVLASRFPGLPLVLLGHSVGCFATGFLCRPGAVTAMVFVAPHTGYYGDYATWQRPGMWLTWHAVMPTITWMVGYFPGKRLGLPEDLPRGVALEWAARRRPDFWWNLRLPDGTPDVVRHTALQQRFATFTGAALAIRLTDDAFATAAGAARIERLFSGVRFEHRVLEPKAYGLKSIGHFGFFRSSARDVLWPHAGNWIRAQRWLQSTHGDA